MSTSVVELDSTAVDLSIDNDLLHVVLADGRELAAPLAWFPRLRNAPAAVRANWRLIGKGQGIHWPDIDETSLWPACFKQVKSFSRLTNSPVSQQLSGHKFIHAWLVSA